MGSPESWDGKLKREAETRSWDGKPCREAETGSCDEVSLRIGTSIGGNLGDPLDSDSEGEGDEKD